LEKVYSGGGGGAVAVALAWIFGLGCIGLGGYIYYMHSKLDRAKVTLNDSTGEIS